MMLPTDALSQQALPTGTSIERLPTDTIHVNTPNAVSSQLSSLEHVGIKLHGYIVCIQCYVVCVDRSHPRAYV